MKSDILFTYKGSEELSLQLELIDSYEKSLVNNNIFRAAVIVRSLAKGYVVFYES